MLTIITNRPRRRWFNPPIVLISTILTVSLIPIHAALGEPLRPSNRPSNKGFEIPISLLDSMKKLPGNITALPALEIPPDNPQMEVKIKLGKMLFFDNRLSFEKDMSCASCHDPELGFSDGKTRAIGFKGKELGRHSPTILNAAYNMSQFWDGRAPSLEEQAKGPILASGEMGMPDIATVLLRIRSVPEYVELFRKSFPSDSPSLSYDNVGKAIAAFERTIITPDSRFDEYMRGNKQALTEQEKKGLILFVGKASCAQCHKGANFTDNKFHNLGVPQEGPLKVDLGRFEVTRDKNDQGAFKTPTVRNINLTAPYMHNGALLTLEEVIDFYDRGGGTAANKSQKILRLNLSEYEKKDLVAFLKTLDGKYPDRSRPTIP